MSYLQLNSLKLWTFFAHLFRIVFTRLTGLEPFSTLKTGFIGYHIKSLIGTSSYNCSRMKIFIVLPRAMEFPLSPI